MSGKSTLLRAVGLATVLALAGAPVTARSLRLSPLLLRTSIRVADSLERGVSHFYAEITRLKDVVEAAKSREPVLFLLDEILHGTNSRERQVGARWVIAELLRRGAIGAVSTHDEELCRLPEDLMDKVALVHLRESVSDGKMTFDFRVYDGPVTSGNALRLMQLVGLEVPLA
jgi:DNA mismatch repair ATPase MutS